MTIQELLEAVSHYFRSEKMDYGIIGAFALYSYGYTRATQDIDFITRSQYKSKINKFLESLGLKTIFTSIAFSNHVHPVGSARVDIMYVDGTTADDIFGSTQKRLVFKNVELPVVSPEHLIAMKLFAIQQNPERKFKDLADIKEILKRVKFDKNVIKEYFKKYGQDAYFKEITGEPDNER